MPPRDMLPGGISLGTSTGRLNSELISTCKTLGSNGLRLGSRLPSSIALDRERQLAFAVHSFVGVVLANLRRSLSTIPKETEQ